MRTEDKILMLTYITISLFHLFCFSLPIFVLSAGNLQPFLSVGKVSAKNPGDLIFKIIWKEVPGTIKMVV